MRSIYKQWPYPKGLKKFIWNNTDFQSNKTLKVSRFVSCLEMYDGFPVERVFGYLSKTKKRKPEDMMVKEVARFYRHKMYLGHVDMNYLCGQKVVYYGLHPDRFIEYRGGWSFYDTPMTSSKQFLADNNLLYTGWEQGSGWGLSFLEYLTRYLENPKVELLSKAGLGMWVRYLRYLDTSKKSLHEIFKIPQSCTPLLKEMSFAELMMCRKLKTNDMDLIRSKVALDQVRRSMLNQYRQCYDRSGEIIEVINMPQTVAYVSSHSKDRYWFAGDYIDYLRDLVKIGAINDPKMWYPKNFQRAHREVNKKVELAKSEALMDGFKKQYRKHRKLVYSDGKLSIRPVKEPAELYSESEALHHCVRTYDRNVSEGLTEILFIRKKGEEDIPYYTLELKNKKVIQVRGKENGDPDDTIKSFVSDWAKTFKLNYDPAQQRRYY